MTLVRERKLLEDRIKMQHRRWNSFVFSKTESLKYGRTQREKMNGPLKVQDMAHFLESTKLDFALGLKEREALLYKLKLEQADDELADSGGCPGIIPQKCSELELQILNDSQENNSVETRKTRKSRKTRRGLRSSNRKSGKDAKEVQEARTHLLEEEMKKLRLEYMAMDCLRRSTGPDIYSCFLSNVVSIIPQVLSSETIHYHCGYIILSLLGDGRYLPVQINHSKLDGIIGKHIKMFIIKLINSSKIQASNFDFYRSNH
ncbi:hypothetical protein ACJRO7_022814 [Eucalyptus globulus]|uniref:Uncharacterized protein n=1 Tax=Eucalyptus globulus TaxID=34317 RepID=A0ABD3K4Q9_EUCGL